MSIDLGSAQSNQWFGKFCRLIRRCMFRVFSVGPIPCHIAFIMDGNRRYARKHNLKAGEGHRVGFLTLMLMLKYCYELEIRYISIFAFSVDNFKRRPEEVQSLMDLMREKIEDLLKEDSIVNQYGVRVYFVGNLKLLSSNVRCAAEKVMKATAQHGKAVLLICLAYSSVDEITHAVEESCRDKRRELEEAAAPAEPDGMCFDGRVVDKEEEEGEDVGKSRVMLGNGEWLIKDGIKVWDIQKHLYTGFAPDPNILIRSSGETRLSNFMLWQTSNCLLYCPAALWPDLTLWHLLRALLKFQRQYAYLEKKRKQA